MVRLSTFWYELALDLIAGSVFIGTYFYLRATRPRLAAQPATSPASRGYYTPIATADAYPIYALMADATSDADGPDECAPADSGGTPQRVPVRFTGELARLAQPAAIRAIPRFCLECLQEARALFPTLEAVGLPLRCARHRMKFDEWVQVAGARLHRHHPVRQGRERLN